MRNQGEVSNYPTSVGSKVFRAGLAQQTSASQSPSLTESFVQPRSLIQNIIDLARQQESMAVYGAGRVQTMTELSAALAPMWIAGTEVVKSFKVAERSLSAHLA
jgi:hypothetical protein